jgi:hypothetical protein
MAASCTLSALALLALPGGGARAQGVHEHGVAELNLVLDDRQLAVELTSPAMNIVGFEHAPRTAAQKRAVADALARLRESEKILGLPAAARCRQESVQVASDLEESHGHGHAHGHHDEHGHGAAPGHGHDHEGHADFEALWRFLCDNPQQLGHIEMRLFGSFPGVERVRVQAVTPRGQIGGELSPAKPRLDL